MNRTLGNDPASAEAYPVDVNLLNETPGLEPGEEFYGQFDLIANEVEGSAGDGTLVQGISFIAGSMRGQGSVRFSTTFIGVEPLTIADVGVGKVYGHYHGNGIPTVSSFAGEGAAQSIGYMISAGEWVGYAGKTNKISWSGKDVGTSVGLSLDDFTGLGIPSMGTYKTMTTSVLEPLQRRPSIHTRHREFNSPREFSPKEKDNSSYDLLKNPNLLRE